ncbi:MAG TPA: 50S ribosomal protein L32e [Methanomassiliicoccales archaeon]|nr:50S ribosomal protein L32e [Methanomassiliicoccales archaeon]
MSPKAKKEIKEFADLPYWKEEHLAALKEMGIEDLDGLHDALSDEETFNDIVNNKKLKGIGQKHAEHWLELIEESTAGGEAEEEKEEAPEAEVVEEAAPAEEPKPKARKEKVEEPEAEVVEEAEVAAEGEYVTQPKPTLDPHIVDQLAKRAEINDRRPEFRHQEWFRFKRLDKGWRRPRGIHNKMRRHYGYRQPVVSIGYRGPKEVRDYHPSGFVEVMVHNVAQLEKVDPKKEAVRVGGTVGYKKRLDIERRADELGIRVLNRTG